MGELGGQVAIEAHPSEGNAKKPVGIEVEKLVERSLVALHNARDQSAVHGELLEVGSRHIHLEPERCRIPRA